MKQLLTIIVIITLMTSCSNRRSGNRPVKAALEADSASFRAKRIYYTNDSTYTDSYESMYIELIKVPFGYRPGDTIMTSSSETFVLRERIK